MTEIEKLSIAQIAAHIKIATCFEMVGIVIRIKETYIAHIVMRVQFDHKAMIKKWKISP